MDAIPFRVVKKRKTSGSVNVTLPEKVCNQVPAHTSFEDQPMTNQKVRLAKILEFGQIRKVGSQIVFENFKVDRGNLTLEITDEALLIGLVLETLQKHYNYFADTGAGATKQ